MKRPNLKKKNDESAFRLTVYQANYVAGKGKETVELATVELAENNSKTNIDFVRKAMSKSKSDGEVHGIIVRKNKENNLMDAWKINPYKSEQQMVGIQIIDPKSGKIKYGGDDGGGWEEVLWEQTPEGQTALKNTRKVLGADYQRVVEKAMAQSGAKDSKKFADHFPDDLIDSVESDFISLVEVAPTISGFHRSAKLMLGDDYEERGREIIKDNKKLAKKFETYFKKENRPVKAKREERVAKDQTITIRLEPKDTKKLEELLILVGQKTGVEITKSWVLRESMRTAYAILKKKYEDM